MRARCRSVGMVLLMVGLWVGTASAQVRQMETVGAYPLRADGKGSSSARDKAVRLALDEAVMRVAVDLVTGVRRSEAADFLPEVLGKDPLDYISRFRIIEDRGERAAMYSNDPKVEFEYVVLVESHIDSARVRNRLSKAGLLASRAKAPAQQVLVVVDRIDDYAAYEALRQALIERVRVKSAVPVEMERGRIVLAIETSRSARQLLDNLLRQAPPELIVTPTDTQSDVLTLRIELQELPEEPVADGLGAASNRPPVRN